MVSALRIKGETHGNSEHFRYVLGGVGATTGVGVGEVEGVGVGATLGVGVGVGAGATPGVGVGVGGLMVGVGVGVPMGVRVRGAATPPTSHLYAKPTTDVPAGTPATQ